MVPSIKKVVVKRCKRHRFSGILSGAGTNIDFGEREARLGTIRTLVLENDLSETKKMAEAVNKLGEEHGIPQKIVFHVITVLGEVISNVIRHGLDSMGRHEVILRLDVAGSAIECEVEDGGKPFNPLTAPLTDLKERAQKRTSGGRGIPMIRQFSDELFYRRENGRNILALKKNITDEE